MSDYTCAKCGATFPPATAPGVLSRLIFSGESYAAQDQDLIVVCPMCGNRDHANQRRFLGGLLGPKAMRAVVYVFFVLVFAFMLAVLLEGAQIFKAF